MHETWVPVPGWEGLYEVSDVGRVRSLPRERRLHHGGVRVYGGKVLQGARDAKGYWLVNLRDASTGRHETHKLHSIVLRAFAGDRPDELEACHNDGNRDNNSLSNLRWDTHLSNMRDRLEHGNVPHGERNHNAKLTASLVHRIRTTGEDAKVLAAELGVTPECIRMARRAANWRSVPTPFCALHGVRVYEDEAVEA